MLAIRLVGGLALTLALGASAARAQDEGDDEEWERERRETPLPGIATDAVVQVSTEFAMGDDYDTDIEVRWRDATGAQRTQRLLDEDAMRSAPARSYRASVVDGGLELLYPSGNRYEDEGTTTRERWELDGDRWVRRWSRTGSPIQRAFRRMRAALARGDLARARTIAAELDWTPNGGHSDHTDVIFMDFLRAAHRVALRERRTDPRAAAAHLIALLDDPPVRYQGYGPEASGICLEEDLPACPRTPAIVLQASAEVVRVANDVAFVLSEGGEHARAVALLEQVITIDPRRPAARLNLADALFALGRADDARVHYREYASLRAAAPASIPPRVTERAR